MSAILSAVDKKLILVVFFLNRVPYSDCVSLTLSGSSSHLVKDKQFTLTCTVSGAENLQDRILFYKDGGGVSFASLKHKLDQCSVFNGPPDRQSYSVECGDGTNSSLSTTKNYSLTINKASDQDVADWFCKLNTVRMSSNTLRLEMSSGPDSVELTSPGNVEEGDDLNVNCAAVCNPPCLFSWSLNNQQTESGSELSVTNVRRNQTGQKCTCTVTNRVSAKSLTKSFTLKVHFGPENIKLNRSSPVQVVEGKNVAVSCEADCDEVCSYKWKCQTKEINDAVLSFTQIRRTEAGVCVSIVTNVNTNKSKNKTVILDVQYQTSVTFLTLNSKSTKITVDELTPMSLRCEVDSNPASHIKLLNNSHILREVKNSKSVEYSWNEAGCLDTGFYTCKAGNNIKSDVSQSVQLNVTCSPRFDHRVLFQDTYFTVEGGNVTLHISVIANPIPTFTWYKLTDVNNKSLGSTQPVLTTNVSAVGEYKLTNVKQEDFGIYQVVVLNIEPNNELVLNSSLKQIVPPTVPSDVRTWSTGPHSVSVSWIEEFNGGSQQTFLVQYRADTTSEWTNLTEQFGEKGLHTNHTAEISSLQPNTRYLIRVLAFNKFGFKISTKEQHILICKCNQERDNLLGAGIGIGTGIGIGILLATELLIGVIVFFFCWKRKEKFKNENTYTSRQFNTGVQESSFYDDLQQSQDAESNTDTSNNYSSLEARKNSPYCVVTVYENSQI